MKKLLLLCLLVGCGCFAQLKGTYKTGEPCFNIDTLSGMYNGTCTVWNKDGSKKLSGSYKNNQKSGKWVFYDSLGRKRAQVTYTDNYTIKKIALRNSAGEPIKQFSNIAFLQQKYMDSITDAKERSLEYKPEYMDSITKVRRERLKNAVPRKHFGYQLYNEVRDSAGIIKYPMVKDRSMLATIAMYRFIEPGRFNSSLFGNKALQESISRYIKGDPSPEVYFQSDFTKQMEGGEALGKIMGAEVVGYKVYELWYFDENRLTAMPRILGICPVVLNAGAKTYESLFWVYYPVFRQKLVSDSVKGQSNVSNLEEVFHFRRFSSFVYHNDAEWVRIMHGMHTDEQIDKKEGNVNLLEEYQKLLEDTMLFEIRPLVLEHACWMFYTK